MEYTKEYLENLLAELMTEVAATREDNKTVPVSGIRGVIGLEDREIDFVFYPARRENAPLILGFHGGGFLFGGSALNDAMWSRSAEVLDANIVSVGYRKSPEYKYPEALEDAHEAALYFSARDEFRGCGYDPAKLMVMGCSAGANLAAALCIHENRVGNSPIVRQILLYPWLDCATDDQIKGGGADPGPMTYIFRALHADEKDWENPLVSPVFAEAEDLAGLPEAIMNYAGEDILMPEGKKYAEMLRSAGVKVSEMTSDGMPHIYFEHGFDPVEKLNVSMVSEEHQEMIRSGRMNEASEETLRFIKMNME